MKYPTGAELEAYLIDAGLLSPSQTLNTDALIAAAVAKWERDTGYHPYLSEDGAEDRSQTFFVPVDFKLFLRNGLLSITSIVRTSDNMSLTKGDDYYVSHDKPITEIVFNCSRFQDVAITGLWGKTTELSDDVRQMLIRLGAHMATSPLEYYNTKGVTKIQTLATTFEFGSAGKNYYWRTAQEFKEDYRRLLFNEKLLGMGN